MGLCISICAATGVHTRALADSTSDNVTVQSSDAFGRAVGNERSGLYTPEEVRGFNPVEAGNARIEGLYFDQVDRIPTRLFPGSTIRVGLSAQRYPFPAPTGLVDYDLAGTATHPEGFATLEMAPWYGPGFRLQGKVPLSNDVGVFAGMGYRDNQKAEGEKAIAANGGVLLRARPFAGAELIGFAGANFNRGDEARPTFFQTAARLPPHVPRRRFLGQKWADRYWVTPVVGAIVKLPLGGVRLESGLFYINRKFHRFYADILTDVAPDGSAGSRTIIADRDNVDKSLSGEVRLVREWTSGSLRHTVWGGVRGRHKQRLFGGAQRIGLGPSSAIKPDMRPQPRIAIGPKSHDDARQLTWGGAYNLYWTGKANFDLSLSKTSYRKRIDFADPSLSDPVTKDSPWLWNAAASFAVTSRLTVYAGAARGIEEALVAPDVASNRDEAPPAIRTRQVEAGFRYAITRNLGLVAGVFSISKPYYNLDPALRFRQLGTIRNRGIELSLTGQLAPGLTLVGGTLLLDPEISGEAVDAGLIARRPVGQAKRRSVLNVDWRPKGGISPWSVDLAIESFSSRVANASNTLNAPPRETVNLGARYRFKMGNKQFLVRPQVQNLFNDYGWLVTPSGGFTYASSRSASLDLSCDF